MNSAIAGFVSAVLPSLLEIAGLFLMAWLARVSTFAKEKWGIEIEAKHREALHSAIMSGIRSAVARGLTGPAAIDAAIQHATASVPDAIAALNPASQVLINIASAKLKEVLG
ncbi:hypothetical protein D2T29_19720 [Sinirhodobacter populi]|uniref:Uncharacterized protein n=1 Tax=Paenirhodobacter populi TaxID=2306993 RepID=A0A443K218_9RHOB|nr:hypothetical protein [Sinirhodobacter populi]RWR26808.1 hypothetical protein D2T29_19720 [Sinirhodobacter populi]